MHVEAVTLTYTLVTRRASICSVVVRQSTEAAGFLGDVVPGATGRIRNADPPAAIGGEKVARCGGSPPNIVLSI
jgi:hypothetical protein